MELNDLLKRKDLDPSQVLVFRHRPQEPELRRLLPWLAADKPKLFNAYQQSQKEKLERVMHSIEGSGYVASFIGQESGKATFVGVYKIVGSKPLSLEAFWRVPEYIELQPLGSKSWFTKNSERSFVRFFDLVLTDIYSEWSGKLIVRWPPPERSWWRRADRNVMPVHAILEESAFDPEMPAWQEIEFGWSALQVLPRRLKAALEQWRGIYYIFDTACGKGYVGSASGRGNILGRWLEYRASGHGGNHLLKARDSANFRFTILQRVSPDMDVADIVQLENTWKQRLHTRHPLGLNEN